MWGANFLSKFEISLATFGLSQSIRLRLDSVKKKQIRVQKKLNERHLYGRFASPARIRGL